MPTKKPARSTRAKSPSKPKSVLKTQKARAPAPKAGAPKRENSKLATIIALLRKPEGTTLEDMIKVTDWQPHSVRGALSGAIKKKMKLDVTSEVTDGVRRYRIPAEG